MDLPPATEDIARGPTRVLSLDKHDSSAYIERMSDAVIPARDDVGRAEPRRLAWDRSSSPDPLVLALP